MGIEDDRPGIEDGETVRGGSQRLVLLSRLVPRDIRLPRQASKIQGELVDLGGQARGRQAGEFLIALYGLLLSHAAIRVHRDQRHGKENDRGRHEGPGENPSSQRAAREESSHAAT